MKNVYECLFRFEDSFEPTDKVNKDNIKESILRHINGEVSSFYSYGRHLVPCMAKYYHYPKDNESVSLYIHKNVVANNSYNVGGFNSYEEAKDYFNSPLFLGNYPSIQDGEVLMEDKLTDGITMRFGYTIYFSVLLTILVCKNGNNVEKYFNFVLKVMNKFSSQLADFSLTSIMTPNEVYTALDLLSYYYKYDRYYCTIEEILDMPIWATTFPAENKRNVLLVKMYKELCNSIGSEVD